MIAISGIPKWKGIYYSEDKEGLSFRWYEDNLLIGGGGHRTGEITPKDGFSCLEKKNTISLSGLHRSRPLVCPGLYYP